MGNVRYGSEPEVGTGAVPKAAFPPRIGRSRGTGAIGWRGWKQTFSRDQEVYVPAGSNLASVPLRSV